MIGTRKEIIADGQTLSYLEHGTSTDTILFLHGWGGSAESFQDMWMAFGDQLSNKRLIALDFPGFGESPAPSLVWSVDDYATCVVKYLDLMHVSVADIVSHSFGGRVSTVLLAKYGDRFRKSVYIAPAGIRHENVKQQQIQVIASTLKSVFSLPVLRWFFPIARKIGYRLIGSRDYVETSGVMKETFKRVIEEDLTPLLPSISALVYIFWGRNDTYVPVGDAAYMKSHIQGSQVTIFEDGRHGIHKTHAVQISEQLIPFLR